MFTYPLTDIMEQKIVKVGDYLEHRIGEKIENSDWNAPVLEGQPKVKIWYKIPIPGGISGDGSEYHIYLKKGTTNRLCIFFSGGGVAWDDYSVANPVTGGKIIAGQPNFYWSNLRPFTQIMNINIGITETSRSWNPFDSWSFIVITYATGDLHLGNNDYPYESEDGTKEVMHFQGHQNFLKAMDLSKRYFPNPRRILIAGDSAGAFAVPALSSEIIDNYYYKCKDCTLFSDSALLLYDDWRSTVRDLWGAEESIWRPIKTNNIYLDWYRELINHYKDQFHYLYACSVQDYLLSSFYNAIHNNDYSTNKTLQEIFQSQLKNMVLEMKKINPKTGFFLNAFHYPLPGISSGGTIHTAVRKPWYHVLNDNSSTMAHWLFDATNGRVYDVGLNYLQI